MMPIRHSQKCIVSDAARLPPSAASADDVDEDKEQKWGEEGAEEDEEKEKKGGDEDRFWDPRSRTSFKFDHLALVCPQLEVPSMPVRIVLLRPPLICVFLCYLPLCRKQKSLSTSSQTKHQSPSGTSSLLRRLTPRSRMHNLILTFLQGCAGDRHSDVPRRSLPRRCGFSFSVARKRSSVHHSSRSEQVQSV